MLKERCSVVSEKNCFGVDMHESCAFSECTDSKKRDSREGQNNELKSAYIRLPGLLLELEMARKKIQAKYANSVLLIINVWLLLKTIESTQHDILEMLYRRREKPSTISCSQYAPSGWYD